MLQTFLGAPGPSHHQSLKTNGRRPGDCAANPRGGFLVVHRMRRTTWTSWLIPADPQPVWDEETPPLGRVPISKSRSPQPQNGQLDNLSPS